MRSRTGCQICRQRKLKCDEVKPTCGQCRKGSRECIPTDGVVFRHQQNASMNGSGDVEDGNAKLGGFYAYKNTFDEKNVWVDVPKQITFFNVTDPYNMESTPEPEDTVMSSPILREQMGDQQPKNYFQLPFDQAPGLEALSAAATINYQYSRPMSLPGHSPGDTTVSTHSSNNLNFILNPTGSDRSNAVPSPAIDAIPTISPRTAVYSRQDPRIVTGHEIAFLLRHYSEAAGQWMDLYDLGCYFSHIVPVQALSNPLLKYAACAYAAKQLGRVDGRKVVMGGYGSRPADMERAPLKAVNWAYVGAEYYDKAISLLKNELLLSGTPDIPVTPVTSVEGVLSPSGNIQTPQSGPRTPGNKKRRLSRPATSSSMADENMAAAAILCVYEMLDNENIAWSHHLSGAKSLFEVAEAEGMMPVESPTSAGEASHRVKPSRGRKATFWNFARQDFLAAFINECPTRLNTEDLELWRIAGLHLDEQGLVMPSNTQDAQYPERQAVMREDMISNALVYVMSKIANFLVSGDSVDHVYSHETWSPAGNIVNSEMRLLERWKELEKELETWHQGLPETFQPCARLPPIIDGSIAASSPRTKFSEIWHSIPMCSSTMQCYAMARILLLLNKPHETTARWPGVSNKLQSYRTVESEVMYHAHEIIGIALARPDGAVRIHQVQSLFVAGQCLQDNSERTFLLDALRSIERDLGWATEYRAKQLIKEWEWNEVAS